MSQFSSDNTSARLDFARLRANGVSRDQVATPIPSHALPSFVGQVATSSAVIALNTFIRVIPTTVLGTEVEGGSGSLDATATPSNSVLVYLIGSFVPSQGDYLICRFVDHRWVAETQGGVILGTPGQGVNLPLCFCPTPATLTMTSAYPTCNYGMFQSGTLQYGPAPSVFPTGRVPEPGFYSTSTFTDPLTGLAFYYYFWCRYNQYFLTRIFTNYPQGDGTTGPYRDGLLYSWIVGGYGNSCHPFSLQVGQPFPGSDASCSVSITG